MTPNFAEKLGRLFDECRSPDGRRYTNLEVVEAINATEQARISPSYLSELLGGKKDNPSLWTVKALADFFGQPMDYFVEPDLSPRTRATLDFERVSSNAGEWTLGARLNLLFTMAANDGSAPPTNAQVASAVAAAGVDVSGQTLAAVRTGAETELPNETLSAIAGYFGVPSAVLTDDRVAEMLAGQLPAMRLLHDATVRRIAFRAHALSVEDRTIVTGLLERLAREDRGMTPDDLDF